MNTVLINVILSAVGISLVLWIGERNITLAGFVASLPLSTMIILALGKLRMESSSNMVSMAKSIFVGIPASLTFFIPFLLSERLKLSFWQCYFSGASLLVVSYFVHRQVAGWLVR